MVLPFVTAITRDVFETVPPMLKEAAYGLGCDHLGGGVEGGAALYAGRRHRRRDAGAGPRAGRDHGGHLRHRQCPSFAKSLLAPGTTISATIANEFTEAVGDLYTSSLIALGLILFVITFIVLAAAKIMLMRLERQVKERTAMSRCSMPAAAWSTPALACRHRRRRLRPGLAALDPGNAALQRHRRAQLGIFTEMTPPPGDNGGLLNAIFGSIILTVGAHRPRHADRHAGGHISRRIRQEEPARDRVRFINDILLSARPRSWSASSSTRCWWCPWAISRPGPAPSRWR